MKTMKKVLALVLAMMLVLGLATVAMAEGVALPNGDALEVAAGTGTVTFKVNYDHADDQNLPMTVFNYTIAPITEEIAATADKPAVKVPGAATLQVGTGTAAASVDVTYAANAAEKDQIVTVNLPSFTAAGIYRYTITQKAISAAQQALGIKAADAADGVSAVTFYLDVYVTNTAEAGATAATYAVTAAALKTTAVVQDEDSTKVDGFYNKYATEGDSEEGDPTTYTVEISKATTGAAADKTQDFAFTLDLTGIAAAADASVQGVKVKFTDPDGTESELTLNAGSGLAAPVTFSMHDGEKVTITGIPVGTTVDVSEGASIYTPSVTVSNMTTNGTTNGTVNTALAASDTVKLTSENENTTAGTIAYTNNLDAISPTGVVLRFAPYVCMLGAAPVLFLVSKKRKEEEEEE